VASVGGKVKSHKPLTLTFASPPHSPPPLVRYPPLYPQTPVCTRVRARQLHYLPSFLPPPYTADAAAGCVMSQPPCRPDGIYGDKRSRQRKLPCEGAAPHVCAYMYINIHPCMYILLYMYICAYMHVIYTCTCMYIYTYLYMLVCTCMHALQCSPPLLHCNAPPPPSPPRLPAGSGGQLPVRYLLWAFVRWMRPQILQ
jgi:hypothetical protein